MRDYTFPAQVLRVIDGDTVVCRIDLGFNIHVDHSIRLADIDAPELFRGMPEEREQGMLAKSHLMNLVAQINLSDDEWPFVLVTEKDKQSFGRYIGTLWEAGLFNPNEASDSLNTQMVESGHAVYSN